MKYQIQVIIALLLFSCGDQTSSNSPTITKGDESIIKEIQITSWQKAYDEQDTVLLDQLFHVDFQLVDDNGDTYSKVDEMSYVANYGPTHNEASFEIIKLNVLENGTAVVFGKGTLKGVEANEAYVTTYNATNVFIKECNDWKVISSHVSGVKEEKFPMVSE